MRLDNGFYPILANLYVDAFVTSVILPLLLRIPFSLLFSSVEGNFMVKEACCFLLAFAFWLVVLHRLLVEKGYTQHSVVRVVAPY